MAAAPSQRQGHLVVAAIRVLEEREKHPPTSDEIAELLGWHPDQAALLTRGLEEVGVLRPVTSPYDVRHQIVDHRKLEELELEEGDAGFADEMADFEEKTRQEQERLERLFQSGEPEAARKQKLKGLDEEFGKFKKDKPLNPFGDD